MKTRFDKNYIIGLAVLVSSWSFATAAFCQTQGGGAAALAVDLQWLRLLHYVPSWFGGYHSPSTSEDFFIDTHGRTDPQAELNASLKAFMAFNTNSDHGDAEWACRFPMRFRYMARRLNRSVPQVYCPKLDSWLAKVRSDSVAVVFAAQYAGNPASFFGHTFLKFHRRDRKLIEEQSTSVQLLDPSFGYFAQIPEDTSAVDYIRKGIFGGFTGNMVLSPFHRHIFDYASAENRSLWEYSLALSPSEVEDLLLHIWEISTHASFDYYYIDWNCSYQVLALLDAIKPEWDLSSGYLLYVLPAATIQRLASTGAITDIHVWPATRDKLIASYDELSSINRQSFQEIIEGNAPPSAATNPRTLETVVLYIEKLQFENKGKTTQANERLLSDALIARAHFPEALTDPVPQDLSSGVHRGHGPYTLGLAGGATSQDQLFADLRFRPLVHGLTDIVNGYQPGIEISLFDTKLRTTSSMNHSKRYQIDLESIAWFHIANLDDFHPLKGNPSWDIIFDTRKIHSAICEECKAVRFSPKFGIGSKPAPSAPLFYLLAVADAEYIGQQDLPFTEGVGAECGVLFHLSDLATSHGFASILRLRSGSELSTRTHFEFNQSLKIKQNLAASLAWKNEDKRYSEGSVEIRYHF